MRLLVLTCALLLAGCTANESPYDPDPGDTDTGSTTVDPETGGPDTMTPGQGGGSFAPQSHHAEARDPELPGLVLEGDMEECDEGFCIDASVRNEGNATYHVQSMCKGPWDDSMRHEGSTVEHREPVAHCQAFELEPFEPGATQSRSFTWNGTLWDGRTMEAPQGAYTWVVEFEVWQDDSASRRHTLSAEFPVVVGPT